MRIMYINTALYNIFIKERENTKKKKFINLNDRIYILET